MKHRLFLNSGLEEEVAKDPEISLGVKDCTMSKSGYEVGWLDPALIVC